MLTPWQIELWGSFGMFVLCSTIAICLIVICHYKEIKEREDSKKPSQTRLDENATSYELEERVTNFNDRILKVREENTYSDVDGVFRGSPVIYSVDAGSYI